NSALTVEGSKAFLVTLISDSRIASRANPSHDFAWAISMRRSTRFHSSALNEINLRTLRDLFDPSADMFTSHTGIGLEAHGNKTYVLSEPQVHAQLDIQLLCLLRS